MSTTSTTTPLADALTAVIVDLGPLAARAIEGLTDLEQPELAAQICESIRLVDLWIEAADASHDAALLTAHSIAVRVDRETQQAMSALGRAPEWCGVCAAVSAYRAATSQAITDHVSDAALGIAGGDR